jgi:hypothetical protein
MVVLSSILRDERSALASRPAAVASIWAAACLGVVMLFLLVGLHHYAVAESWVRRT